MLPAFLLGAPTGAIMKSAKNPGRFSNSLLSGQWRFSTGYRMSVDNSSSHQTIKITPVKTAISSMSAAPQVFVHLL